MWNKINDRDKRAIVLGTIVVIGIIIYIMIGPWLEDWKVTRKKLQAKRQLIKSIGINSEGKLSAAQLGILSAVPKYEEPKKADNQSVLFRNEINKQITSCGIKAKSLQYLTTRKANAGGTYKTLRLQCVGQCSLNQVFDLLGKFNENPYFVGVDELNLNLDEKDRKKINMTRIVSTLCSPASTFLSHH